MNEVFLRHSYLYPRTIETLKCFKCLKRFGFSHFILEVLVQWYNCDSKYTGCKCNYIVVMYIFCYLRVLMFIKTFLGRVKGWVTS